MNPRITYMLVLAFALSLVHGSVAAGDADAALKSAERLAEAGQRDDAEREFLRACDLLPAEGFYRARLGQFYFSRLNDYPRAIEAYREAERLGFVNAWMYAQAGRSAARLGRFSEGEEWFNRGLAKQRARLADPKRSDRAAADREDLASLWNARIDHYSGADRFTEASALAERAVAELPGETARYAWSAGWAAWWASVDAAARADYAGSSRIMARACAFLAKDRGASEKIGSLPERLQLMEARRDLGKISPRYVHRIALIIYRKTEARSGPETVNAELSDRELAYARRSLIMVRAWCEAMSGGNFSIEWKEYVSSGPLTALVFGERSGDRTANRKPDLDALAAADPARYRDAVKENDTLLLLWNAGEYNVANGGQCTLEIDGRRYRRGYLHLPGGRLTWNGPSLAMHEFFHVIERIVGITPLHGMEPGLRRNFPGWKGEGELDYYRWHFMTSVRAFVEKADGPGPAGWRRMGFLWRDGP